MAEHDFAEEYTVNPDGFQLDLERCEAITGGGEKNKFLLYQLKYSMMQADRIDIIVSLMYLILLAIMRKRERHHFCLVGGRIPVWKQEECSRQILYFRMAAS